MVAIEARYSLAQAGGMHPTGMLSRQNNIYYYY